MTALWNTNAFFAYVFTVALTGAKWDVRRLAGVIIATAGALAVVYGGSTAEADKTPSSDATAQQGRTAPLIGDLMTLAASIGYAGYQVFYKLYAALPNDPEVQADAQYAPLAASVEDLSEDVEGMSGCT